MFVWWLNLSKIFDLWLGLRSYSINVFNENENEFFFDLNSRNKYEADVKYQSASPFQSIPSCQFYSMNFEAYEGKANAKN